MLHLSDKGLSARSLWEICFNDPAVFVNLYFSEVYKDDNTLLLYEEKGEKAVAHVQMIPYQLHFSSKEPMQASYISGACTHPEYRNRGFMSQLMQEALQMMYAKGDIYSFLIPAEPWLFDFYQKSSSYSPAFTRDTLHFSNEYSHEQVAEIISKKYAACKGPIVLHNEKQAQIVAKDLSLAGVGGCVISQNRNSRIYYLLRNNTMEIKGCTGKPDKDLLLNLLCKYKSSFSQIEAVAPWGQQNNDYKATSMIRILDPLRALNETNNLSEKIPPRFVLHDPQLPQNDGIYQYENGRYKREETQGQKKERETVSAFLPCLTITDLNQYIVQEYPSGFFNLLLD
ncbi:acetyltransferase [Porphyromonas crevioricanis JCM 15906]|uniref:Acetyltransferase n=1 Tax=Porphyromonas crevioricanis JCM 15906 TaxID=1305617 RepID=T1CQJ6_9PORP|nr:GNAT family N-acetyltransferase [Porphyromonas crevioricanis]GAD05353.1 acetyltransferase [Porphyromonas crevioricanis JCM 15906]SJZ57121.1 Predicted acetyltransferase [Porphyromonas crevioricanis]